MSLRRCLAEFAVLIVLAALAAVGCSPAPGYPIPTEAQVEWQKMEMNMFVHFGPNTFSGLEWGTGQEAEDLFRPTALDCRQWARTAKAAGMKGIILTAKHHDGFCLWPNPVSTHCAKDVDVLKELSDACREEGLKFGVYISPWDRDADGLATNVAKRGRPTGACSMSMGIRPALGPRQSVRYPKAMKTVNGGSRQRRMSQSGRDGSGAAAKTADLKPSSS